MIPGKNDEARMTNEEGNSNFPRSGFVIPSGFDIRYSSFSGNLVSSASELAKLISVLEPYDRVAIDTEADSLHCYREKLCLLQVSIANAPSMRGLTSNATSVDGVASSGKNALRDFIVDPLADIDFTPLRESLERKEVVLHGADYDLRLLRRSLNFQARWIFDTVIAARLLGIQAFSLAALVQKYFGIELPKGSQKANWAQRPLPPRMIEYAINDTHYLLPLANLLELELERLHRLEWFQQSCRRAIEQAAVDRPRDAKGAWRISGSGTLRGRAAAILRELWHWREREAEAADRPPFHILQNHELLDAAESFAAGGVADYRHFSPRRRRAFREAAERGTQMAEADWPVVRRRFGTRLSREIVRRIDELKLRRDSKAAALGLEPAFVAPRSTLESIAVEEKRAETLLVPWQRELLGIGGG
jgi:ribonuclease D